MVINVIKNTSIGASAPAQKEAANLRLGAGGMERTALRFPEFANGCMLCARGVDTTKICDII
jgi:hypothetical protein